MPGYEEVVERSRRSTVQVLNGRGGGSGVVWVDGALESYPASLAEVDYLGIGVAESVGVPGVNEVRQPGLFIADGIFQLRRRTRECTAVAGERIETDGL